MIQHTVTIGLSHGSNEADEVAKDVLALLETIPDAYHVVHFEVSTHHASVIEVKADDQTVARLGR